MNLFLALIIILGICGIMYIYLYNSMQYLKTKIEQAESLIDDTLRDRYDILMRANDIIKSSLNNNKEYFKEYISLKDKDITNFELDRKLKEAFNLVYKLVDDNESLQNNDELKKVFKEIKLSNEKIAATTKYYNKNMTDLNTLVRKFPSNIISKIHGFKVSPYFDGKDLTDDIYNDFKL